MRIRYIYHSAYEVMTDRHQLIFDYYKGRLDILDEKTTIAFVSHSHGDHFSESVFDWADHVVLWDGIGRRGKHIHPLGIGDTLTLDGLTVLTSGSTDEGLSFEVQTEGKRLIFAGDLHDWNWPDDTPEEEQAMHELFVTYISKFKPNPDALFFPVDYRLEHNYIKGADFAVRLLKPTVFFPLHFTAHPEILADFEKAMRGRVRVVLPGGTPYELD